MKQLDNIWEGRILPLNKLTMQFKVQVQKSFGKMKCSSGEKKEFLIFFFFEKGAYTADTQQSEAQEKQRLAGETERGRSVKH